MIKNDLKHENGSALLLVLVFLGVVISITLSCAMTVTVLQKELRLIEKKHDSQFNVRNAAP